MITLQEMREFFDKHKDYFEGELVDNFKAGGISVEQFNDQINLLHNDEWLQRITDIVNIFHLDLKSLSASISG